MTEIPSGIVLDKEANRENEQVLNRAIETALVKHGDHEKLDYEHEILTAVDNPAFLRL